MILFYWSTWMRVADAHCDTLTAFSSNPFRSLKAHWNVDKFAEVGGVLQYMAIFTDEQHSGVAATAFALNHVGRALGQMPDSCKLLERRNDFEESKINILLALEGASPLVNDINNLYAFYKAGIRAITLTWNHRNFVGDGWENPYGLTKFGIDVIKEMQRIGIIIDVSHLNPAGFDDVLKHTTKPFMASHSNSFTIHGHRRNLTDDQIKDIVARKGFIGLNFYSEFIGKDNDTMVDSFLAHIEHMIKLGGENSIGLGSDFDGMAKSPFADALAFAQIEGLLRNSLNLSDDVIDKIMFKNLVKFTLENI